jgi:Holliday junction resolvase-like predicted endonuclease
MSKRQEVFRQQMQDSYDKLNARLEAMTLESEIRVREINRVFHEQMFENDNRYQQQIAIMDAEALRQRNQIEVDVEKQRKLLKSVSEKVDKSTETFERRMDEVQSSVEVLTIQVAELVRSTPPRVEVDPGDPKPVSFQQVAEMFDASNERVERVCCQMSESIHEVTNTMGRKIEDNSQYFLQRLDTGLRDVHERIDVVSETVNARVVKVSEETTITPDSDDIHEIKGVEFVTQRVSDVPRRKNEFPGVPEHWRL